MMPNVHWIGHDMIGSSADRNRVQIYKALWWWGDLWVLLSAPGPSFNDVRQRRGRHCRMMDDAGRPQHLVRGVCVRQDIRAIWWDICTIYAPLFVPIENVNHRYRSPEQWEKQAEIYGPLVTVKPSNMLLRRCIGLDVAAIRHILWTGYRFWRWTGCKM